MYVLPTQFLHELRKFEFNKMPDDDEKSVEEAYLDDLTKSRGWYVTSAVSEGKYKVALEGEKNGRLPTLDTVRCSYHNMFSVESLE